MQSVNYTAVLTALFNAKALKDVSNVSVNSSFGAVSGIVVVTAEEYDYVSVSYNPPTNRYSIPHGVANLPATLVRMPFTLEEIFYNVSKNAHFVIERQNTRINVELSGYFTQNGVENHARMSARLIIDGSDNRTAQIDISTGENLEYLPKLIEDFQYILSFLSDAYVRAEDSEETQYDDLEI